MIAAILAKRVIRFLLLGLGLVIIVTVTVISRTMEPAATGSTIISDTSAIRSRCFAGLAGGPLAAGDRGLGQSPG